MAAIHGLFFNRQNYTYTFSAQPAVFDIDIVYFQLENQSLAGIGRPEDWIYKRRIGHTEHDLVCCINSVLEHHETLKR